MTSPSDQPTDVGDPDFPTLERFGRHVAATGKRPSQLTGWLAAMQAADLDTSRAVAVRRAFEEADKALVLYARSRFG